MRPQCDYDGQTMPGRIKQGFHHLVSVSEGPKAPCREGTLVAWPIYGTCDGPRPETDWARRIHIRKPGEIASVKTTKGSQSLGRERAEGRIALGIYLVDDGPHSK